MQRYLNVQCYVPDTLHIFMIPCDNYQYRFANISLLHVITLSHNWMTPIFILSGWWLFPVLSTHVQRLKCRFLTAFIYTNITIPSLFFLFRCYRSLLFALNSICTPSFYLYPRIYLFPCCFPIPNILLLRWRFQFFQWHVHFLVDAQFKKVGTYSNVPLDSY